MTHPQEHNEDDLREKVPERVTVDAHWEDDPEDASLPPAEYDVEDVLREAIGSHPPEDDPEKVLRDAALETMRLAAHDASRKLAEADSMRASNPGLSLALYNDAAEAYLAGRRASDAAPEEKLRLLNEPEATAWITDWVQQAQAPGGVQAVRERAVEMAQERLDRAIERARSPYPRDLYLKYAADFIESKRVLGERDFTLEEKVLILTSPGAQTWIRGRLRMHWLAALDEPEPRAAADALQEAERRANPVVEAAPRHPWESEQFHAARTRESVATPLLTNPDIAARPSEESKMKMDLDQALRISELSSTDPGGTIKRFGIEAVTQANAIVALDARRAWASHGTA